MPEFAIGDYVEILCCDGARFVGVLQDFTEDYVLLNGYGYALDMILVMSHA
jgi:hypothetical protein